MKRAKLIIDSELVEGGALRSCAAELVDADTGERLEICRVVGLSLPSMGVIRATVEIAISEIELKEAKREARKAK